MNNKESIIKGIFSYSIPTWINLIVGMLSVVVMTRVVKPDVYGLISIFFSASSVLMYILSLGMDGAYIRFYNEPPGGDTKYQLLYKNLVWSFFIYAISSVVMVLFLGDTTSIFIFGISARILTGLLFLYTLCNILLRYLNISFRMSFQVKRYTIQNVLINCISRVLIIVAAFFTDDFTYIITVLTIGLFTILVLYMYKQRSEYIPYNSDGKIDRSLKIEKYGEYVRFAIFGAPTYIVTYLNTYLCQQIIRSDLNAYALGIFSSTGMFVHILTALKGGFGTYWSAYVYKNYKTEQDKIAKMHDFVLVFSILMVSLVVIFRDVIFLFIGKDYHESKQFFSLLLFFPIMNFIAETTEKGIAIAKKNQILIATHTISVAVNILLCIFLIPLLGLKGAAYANATAAVVLYISNTFWGQRYYKTIKSRSKSALGTTIVFVMLIFPAIVYDIKWIIAFSLILDIMTGLLYYKELHLAIKSIFSFFRRK